MQKESNMKKLRKVVLLFSCLVASTGMLAAELPGTPVFTDDFDVPALFIENWSATIGTSLEDDRVVINHQNSHRNCADSSRKTDTASLTASLT